MATERERTIEALKTAIRMELDGKAFYQKTSRESRSKLGKELLEGLAAEEDIHRARFEEIFRALEKQQGWPPTPFRPDGGRGLRTLFARALNEADSKAAPASELDALQTAMDMENKTYDFYMGRSREASGEAERKYYETLAGEEKEHHLILLDYYEYLKDPAAWFTYKEHPSLDGG